MTTRGETPRSTEPTIFGRFRKGAVGTALLAGTLFAGGMGTMITASAHTPTATLTCDTAGPVLNVSLTAYIASQTNTNTVAVTVDGVLTDNANFGTTFLRTYHINAPGAAFVSHTAEVNVTAWDDPTGSNGWTKDIKLTAPACQTLASPSIATTPSAGGPIGTVLSDVANVTGGISLNTGTGKVNFKLFGPTDTACHGTPVFTSPNIPASASTGTTAQFRSGNFAGALTAGAYSWTADYTGDASNNPASSACTKEVTLVGKSGPSIVTTPTPSAGGPIDTPISDSATLTGATSPTGTVTFKLFGPTDQACAGTPLFTSAVALPSGSATVTSAAFSGTSTAGTYSWTADYSGDANNAAASSLCTVETVVITSIAPITTISPPPSTSSGGGQGVQGLTTAVTTPGTGGDAAVGKLTVGGFLLLGGLGVALFGYMIPRRRRINS
jgi:hypothetical protein